MRKVLLLFILVPGMLYAQVINEDFESGLTGEWLQTASGRWEADSLFAINGKFSLHHSFDNPESGRDMTGTGLAGLQPDQSETIWSARVRHAYNPSSSNNWSFFLLSDKPPGEMHPGAPVSGYALGVNLSGYDDTLCLWKIKNGEVSKTASTTVNWQYDIGVDSAAYLEVRRSVTGSWDIFIQDQEKNMTRIGSGIDSELFYPGWTGIMYEYSSSQDQKLWIDDIYIDGFIYIDDKPPRVDTVYFSSADKMKIRFSEPLVDNLNPCCFRLSPGNISPVSVTTDGNECSLIYETGLANKVYYNLHVSGICDPAGNCCDTTIESIALALPERCDIIITEVMPDPEPPAGLPPSEYIELYNKSGFDMNISGLQLIIGKSSYTLPPVQIKAGEYVIVTDEEDSSSFSCFGKIVTIDSEPGLKNTGDLLQLVDHDGVLIHGIEYDIGWYSNRLKQYGGWSLEMIDFDYPFSGSQNWSASTCSSGGTPGRANSVYHPNPDMDKPVLINIYAVNPVKVILEFSETMDNSALGIDSWAVSESVIKRTEAEDPLLRKIAMVMNDSLREGTVYEIFAEKEITDIAGNQLIIRDNRLGLAVSTESRDILFNEVMYDPLPGGADFIEFFNDSEKITDLSDHFVVSYDRNTSDTGRIVWLSDNHRCLMPGDYYVITTDRDAVINQYACSDGDRIFELGSLPSMPDKEGNLILFNRNMIFIDEMNYSDDMHFDMLSVTSGVSLERVNTGTASTGGSRWRSASGTTGYASPGIVNSSDVINDNNNSTGMELSSRRISPDNDGFEDFLEIIISSDSDQNILNLVIYNDMGYPVRKLANNLTLARKSVFTWDGIDEAGNPVREGIYVVCSIIVTPGRSPFLFKEVCAVVYY